MHIDEDLVASHAEARIEIFGSRKILLPSGVASHAEARIEISMDVVTAQNCFVASHAEARIEINSNTISTLPSALPLMQRRELK